MSGSASVAHSSADRRFRYALWRVWDLGRGLCNFVMLIQSTACPPSPSPCGHLPPTPGSTSKRSSTTAMTPAATPTPVTTASPDRTGGPTTWPGRGRSCRSRGDVGGDGMLGMTARWPTSIKSPRKTLTFYTFGMATR